MMKFLVLCALVISLCHYVVCDADGDDYEDIKMEDGEQQQEVKIEELNEVTECEKKANYHDMLSIHYTGTFADGRQFDSSRDNEQPINFQLGYEEIFHGGDEGIVGMCPGSRRRITVLSKVNDDEEAGGATRIFDVEVFEVKDGPDPENSDPEQEDVFKVIDTDGDERVNPAEMLKYLKNDGEPDAEEFTAEIMKDYDTDKDGMLTYEELIGHDEL